MLAFPAEEFRQADPILEHSGQIASVHQQKHRPILRVGGHGRLLETVDRDEETQSVVEFAPDLASEAIEISNGCFLAPPPGLEEELRAFEGEGTVDLLPDDSERCLGINIETGLAASPTHSPFPDDPERRSHRGETAARQVSPGSRAAQPPVSLPLVGDAHPLPTLCAVFEVARP